MSRFHTAPVVVFAVAMLAFTAGCARKRIQAAKPPLVGASETGIASWYGVPYHGRRAANGEIYDMEKLTAAHRTLPFDTWVRVKNLDNGKIIDVRIQDRGPFIEGRIIDLSRAAARAIDMIGPGTAKVRLTIIKEPAYTDVPPPPEITEAAVKSAPVVEAPTSPSEVVEPELYAVQVGAFQDRNRAQALADSLREEYGSARLVLRQGNPSVWRVLIGQEESTEEAAALAERLKAKFGSAFVVRLDVEKDNPSATGTASRQ